MDPKSITAAHIANINVAGIIDEHTKHPMSPEEKANMLLTAASLEIMIAKMTGISPGQALLDVIKNQSTLIVALLEHIKKMHTKKADQQHVVVE